MNILFTICGRAGSKGFKNKNVKEMNGVPLVCYTLSTIRLFMLRYPENYVKVAINTDSKILIETIEKQKLVQNISFVERKKELAGDKIAKVDVIRDTYRSVAFCPDVVIDLDITSPLRTVDDVFNTIGVYQTSEKYDLVTSVVKARRSPYFNMVEKKGGFYRKICDSSFTTRQETPSSYELNASIYAYRPGFLDEDIEDTILDHQCGIYLMRDYLVLDIDSEEDFRMMEVLHRFYMGRDKGLKEVYDCAMKYK